MNSVISVHNLTKIYDEVIAVDQVSFTVEKNKIYGLLGRNGAGKTTLMQILSAQQFATSGEVKVFGAEPYENNEVLSQICFIKEGQKYPDHFRVMDVLDVSAMIFPHWDPSFADQLIADFALPLKRRMKKCSRGMLSSVGIVIGLASRAPLTIFDEPYLGLDAVARSLFYDRLMEDYAQYPRTILLSTHLIDEVSRLLEHVLVIDKGHLIVNESADDLREKAYSVVGAKSKLKSFVADKVVLEEKVVGGLASATIWGHYDSSVQQQVEALGLEFSSVSLQQLIIYLTNLKKDQKEEEQ